MRLIWMRTTLACLSAILMTTSAVGQTVTGSGTSNTVPVFNGTSSIGNSPISVSGSNVGIGTTNPPQYTLDVNGIVRASDFILSSGGSFSIDASQINRT